MPLSDGDELPRLLLENLRDYAIFTLDAKRRVARWTPGAQGLFGHAATEIVGRNFTHLYEPLDSRSPRAGQCLDLAGKSGRHEDESWWRRKDGSRFRGQNIHIALHDPHGRLRGFAIVARDITLRAQALEDRATLAVTYDHAPLGIARVALDGGGQFLDVNDKFCEILGYSRAQLLKMTVEQITDPATWARERKLVRQLRAGEIDTYSIEKSYRHGKGQTLWVRITSSQAGHFVGRPYRISIVEDITAAKKADAALRDSEQRVRAILETAVDAIITIDDSAVIRSANPATEDLFGYREDELVGKNVKMLMPEPYHGEHDGYVRRYLKTGRARIIGTGREVIGLRKDGTTFPMNLSVSEVRADGGRLFTGIVHDLSRRRQLERQILEAASNEQRRIGQDLHDGLCQDLIGIAFAVDAAARGLPAGATASLQALNALSIAVRQAAGQARDFAHGLNPVDVRAGGFDAAMENLAAKVSQSFGVRCEYHSVPTARVRNDAAATHLYRIVQEAVSNAIRHGQANRVRIDLAEHGRGIALCVSDNGSGIPKATAAADATRSNGSPGSTGSRQAGSRQAASRRGPQAAKNGRPDKTSRPPAPATGIGLQTMNYRARVIGGTFEITPRKGGGTVVTCRIG